MATKNDLSKLLGGEEESKKPVIRRGKGLQLSTEQQPEPVADAKQPDTQTETKPQDSGAAGQPAEASSPAAIEIAPLETTQKRTKAKSQNRTNAKARNRTKSTKKTLADLPVKHKRVNRGYKLREDLIKSCKRVALEEDRKLYEVMEEALSFYLAHKFKEKS